MKLLISQYLDAARAQTIVLLPSTTHLAFISDRRIGAACPCVSKPIFSAGAIMDNTVNEGGDKFQGEQFDTGYGTHDGRGNVNTNSREEPSTSQYGVCLHAC